MTLIVYNFSIIKSQKQSVGCVGESLIPTDKAYLVEFQDKHTSNDPSLCWKTCEEVYPQTSLGKNIPYFPAYKSRICNH